METTPDTPAEQTALLDDYLTPKEVAALLKFRTPRPVYDAIGRGELAAFQLGRVFRIAAPDLRAWLNRNRLQSDPLTDEPAVVKDGERRGGRSAAAALGAAA
jgi:excisionase family DNA binding protein